MNKIKYYLYSFLIDIYNNLISGLINSKAIYVISLPENDVYENFHVLRLSMPSKTIFNLRAYKNSLGGNKQADLYICTDYIRQLLVDLHLKRIKNDHVLHQLSNKVSFEKDRIVLDYGAYDYNLVRAIDSLYMIKLTNDTFGMIK